MAIEFQCPECKASVRVPDIHGGKKACCPGCRKQIRIPAAEKSVVTKSDASEPAAAKPSVEPAADVKPPTALEAPSVATAEAPKAEAALPTPPSSAAAEPAPATAPAAPPAPAAPAGNGKSAYIKFTCPACGKMTGFEAKLAGTALPCPNCKAKVMVPEQSGTESFIVGATPGASPTGPRKATDAHTAHPHAHKPVKKKAEKSGFPVLGALAGTAGIALIITAAVYWPRKIPGSGAEHSAATKTPPAATVPVTSSASPTPAPANATEKPATITDAPKTVAVKSNDEQLADANDTMEIGARPDAPQSPITPAPKVPESVPDLLSAKEKKTAHSDDENSGTKVEKSAAASDVNSDVMKELVKHDPPPDDGDTKPADTRKTTPATPATPPAKTVAAPNVAPTRALNPAAPAPAPGPTLCPQCLGMGTVPILGARAYVRFPNEPLNAATTAAAVPWKLCPKCQAGKDPQTLLAAESTRLSGVAATNEHWEQLTHAKLTQVETHHVTIRSTMPEPDVRNVAMALEQLTGQLEQSTQTTVLTQTRPDTDELLIGWDVQGYMAFVQALMQIDPNHDWALAQASGGCLLPHRGIFNANHGLGVNPKHMAVYQFGELLMMQATDNKAPTWLRYGFASYCENAITHKNLVYAFQYEKNEVRFSDNWENEIRKYASQGKLKTWDQAFLIQPVGMTSLDYLTCYSMVSFLMTTDPKLFPKYCLAIKDGLDSEKAFEKVYNTDIKKVQTMWSTWALTLRN